MSTEELTRQLAALPLAERVDLAQALWQRVHEDLAHDDSGSDEGVVELARRRDAELTSGVTPGRSHEEVMRAARGALR